MDYIHLVGAEDVRAAGNTMVSAAKEMAMAAGNIEDTLFRHRQWMDEWLSRFEAAISKIGEE